MKSKKKVSKVSKSYPEGQVVVILEDLRDQFRAFGEGQSFLSDKVDNLEKRFDGLESRFDGLEGRFDGLEGRFDGLEGRFDGLEGRFDGLESKVDRIASDVVDIKHELKRKVDMEDFQKLEKRVIKLEKAFLVR